MSLLLLYRSRGVKISGVGGGGGWIPREVQKLIDELWNYRDDIPKRRRKKIPEFEQLKVKELEVPDILRGLIILVDSDYEEDVKKKIRALENLLGLSKSTRSKREEEAADYSETASDFERILSDFESALRARQEEIQREKEAAEYRKRQAAIRRKKELEEEEELIALILAIID